MYYALEVSKIYYISVQSGRILRIIGTNDSSRLGWKKRGSFT